MLNNFTPAGAISNPMAEINEKKSQIFRFCSLDAEKYGVNEAIILHNIRFWTKINIQNNQNINDGMAWTYNSVSKFKEIFPFLSFEQIKYALKNLVKSGILKTGNFNKMKRDRTTWYATTDQLMPPHQGIFPNHSINDATPSEKIPPSIVEISPIHCGNFTNPLGNFPPPLPDINPNPNPNKKLLMENLEKEEAPAPLGGPGHQEKEQDAIQGDLAMMTVINPQDLFYRPRSRANPKAKELTKEQRIDALNGILPLLALSYGREDGPKVEKIIPGYVDLLEENGGWASKYDELKGVANAR